MNNAIYTPKPTQDYIRIIQEISVLANISDWEVMEIASKRYDRTGGTTPNYIILSNMKCEALSGEI